MVQFLYRLMEEGRGGTDTMETPQAATWALSFTPATTAHGMATTTQYSPATGWQLWPTTLHQHPPPPPRLQEVQPWACHQKHSRHGALVSRTTATSAAGRRRWLHHTMKAEVSRCLPLLESFSDVVRVCEIIEATEKASEQPSCDMGGVKDGDPPHAAPQPSEVAAAVPTSSWPTGQGKHRQEVSRRGHKQCTACEESECTGGCQCRAFAEICHCCGQKGHFCPALTPQAGTRASTHLSGPPTSGAVIVGGVHGNSLHHIAEGAQRLYLSLEACKVLHLVHYTFPCPMEPASVCTAEPSDSPIAPRRLESPPYKLVEENMDCLEAWFLEHFRHTVFAPAATATAAEDEVRRIVDLHQVEEEAEQDEEYQLLRECVANGGWAKRKDQEPLPLHQYFRMRHNLSCQGCVVLYTLDEKHPQLVVPAALRTAVLANLHAGHQGRDLMLRRARQSVYSSGIDAEMEQKKRQCEVCDTYAPSSPMETLLPTQPPQYPFQQALKRPQPNCSRDASWDIAVLRHNQTAYNLKPLVPCQRTHIQNPGSGCWDRAGTVLEITAPRQYLVRLDGSRRATIRKRRHLHPFRYEPYIKHIK
ncbi:uncharacterized protein E2C01_049904 [Portunus trituberculatus]|uniref:RNA-directed DNA polymerase n=1 Tax=Portunus trituberculatus TaxID=210409 RepID=A0A5B7GEC4_PORTR|nr:uncharacterized protein [Portunus trituberculatus]